jgi:hypothetical protein
MDSDLGRLAAGMAPYFHAWHEARTLRQDPRSAVVRPTTSGFTHVATLLPLTKLRRFLDEDHALANRTYELALRLVQRDLPGHERHRILDALMEADHFLAEDSSGDIVCNVGAELFRSVDIEDPETRRKRQRSHASRDYSTEFRSERLQLDEVTSLALLPVMRFVAVNTKREGPLLLQHPRHGRSDCTEDALVQSFMRLMDERTPPSPQMGSLASRRQQFIDINTRALRREVADRRDEPRSLRDDDRERVQYWLRMRDSVDSARKITQRAIMRDRLLVDDLATMPIPNRFVQDGWDLLGKEGRLPRSPLVRAAEVSASAFVDFTPRKFSAFEQQYLQRICVLPELYALWPGRDAGLLGRLEETTREALGRYGVIEDFIDGLPAPSGEQELPVKRQLFGGFRALDPG